MICQSCLETFMMQEKIISISKWKGHTVPSESGLRELFQQEGLTPHRWSNAPGDVYEAHAHTYHKVVYVLSGSITFGFPVEGQPTTLYPGDRLDLPAGVTHNAAVGPKGVVCLEAHK